jgi:hypothetical protein
MTDDDKLDIDLSAWDVPPPPADLADAVIDRMGGTDVGLAVPVDEPTTPRRAWIIGGVAVAVVLLGLGLWSLVRSTDRAAPASGGVVADHARSLSLDTVHADLDAGANVRWKRDGNVLRVEQRAGRVAWRVDAGEQLVIDAGAALASVEATGANLRVEVQMNAMDARVIGASAVTAAAVAMVTVVVYEGHVKIGQPGGQTVVVAPGTTYQVKAEDKAPIVGSGPVAGGGLAILGLELLPSGPGVKTDGDGPVVAQVLYTTIREAAKTSDPGRYLAASDDKQLTDEKLLMNCADEAPTCMAAIGATFGADRLLFGHVQHTTGGYQITLKLLDVAQKQLVKSGSWLMPEADAQGEGFDTWGRKVYLDITGTTATACDADALKDKGMQNINLGQHAAALADFEASLRCKHDPYVVQLAFMESCGSANSVKAKLYYKQLTQAQQAKFAQMCIRTKTAYTDDAADTSCDEVSCVLTNYEGACCDKFKKVPDSFDRAAITKEMNRIKPDIYACAKQSPAGGKVKVQVAVKPDGSVKSAFITETPDRPLGTCVQAVIVKAKFQATKNGGMFVYPFVFSAGTPVVVTTETEPPANCDADALKEQAMEAINLAQHAHALAKLEASLQCKRDPYVVQLAFMEACMGQNAAKAKQYYRQLSAAQQAKFAQICVRTKTDYQ